jgi:MFS family permease
VLTPFPLFLQVAYDMDTSLIFALTLVRALTSAPCYPLAGRWTHRLGPYRLQSWALMGRLVTFCSLGALVWVSNLGFTLAVLVGFNIFLGLSWCGIAVAGPTLVGNLSTPGHQGEAMGLYNAVQGLAQICGAVLGGCLASWIGYYSTFVFAGLLLIPAITLLMRLGPQAASAPLEHQRDSRAAARTQLDEVGTTPTSHTRQDQDVVPMFL